MRKYFIGSILLCVWLGSFPSGAAQNTTQNVRLDQELQIPGDVLKPGNYTFSVEDTMRDRAIVRIENADKEKHYLVLAVPNTKPLGEAVQNGLILFQSKNDKKQVLKGWACPGCATSLEFVYPRLEAAKITADSGESVLAVDPESDKLPVKLGADDMKVVTLWLLSPKRVTAEDKEKGVVAKKYKAPQSNAATTTETAEVTPGAVSSETASAAPNMAQRTSANPPPPAQPAEVAQNQTPGESPNPAPVRTTGERSERLPKTASNTFSFALLGLLALMAGAGLRVRRVRRLRG